MCTTPLLALLLGKAVLLFRLYIKPRILRPSAAVLEAQGKFLTKALQHAADVALGQRSPDRRVPQLVSGGRLSLPWLGSFGGCPCTHDPAQSVAITAVTDGLPPRLGIDRFHASRLRNVRSLGRGTRTHPTQSIQYRLVTMPPVSQPVQKKVEGPYAKHV